MEQFKQEFNAWIKANKHWRKWRAQYLVKKFFFNLLLVFLFPFGIGLVLLIRIFSLYKPIKIGEIRGDRIGHFVADSVDKICDYKSKKSKEVRLYWIQNSCNKFWGKVVKRSLPVAAWVELLDRWNKFIPGWQKNYEPSSNTGSRDIQGKCYFKNSDNLIKILKTEEDTGFRFLKKYGFRKNQKIITLVIRDRAYLKINHLHNKGSIASWDYHNYRDTDPVLFTAAIKKMCEENYFVIRLGSICQKKIQVKHKNFLDYAFCKEKSPFLDIWLQKKSSFCISTNTGLDEVSSAFQVPTLFINVLPFLQMPSYRSAAWIPKRLVWKKTGKLLNLQDYFDHSFLHTNNYRKHKILIKNLSQTEIKKTVLLFLNNKIKRIYSPCFMKCSNKLLPQQSKKLHQFIHPNFSYYLPVK